MTGRPPVISLAEYESRGIGGAGELTSAEADLLVSDRLRELAGCDNRYEWFSLAGSKSIRAGCWVGVIQIGRRTVEVLPKIEDAADGMRVDLNAMLAASLGIKGVSRISSHGTGGKFIEFFAYDYARRVSALIQRGLPHRYVEQRGLLHTVKGRLDLQRQIQADAAAMPCVACTYDSFVADNPLSQYLKAALVAATRLRVGARTRQMLAHTLAELDHVADRTVDQAELRNFTLSRNERDLSPLCNLASLLLRGKSFDTRLASATGQRQPGFTLMFNMWEIFESYAVHELNLVLKDSPWVAHGHGKRLDGKAWYLGENKLVQLKPDIVIRKRAGDRAIVCVADTKWKVDAGYAQVTRKSKKGGQTVKGVQPADAYQALAYTATISADEGRNSGNPLPVAIVYPKIGQRVSVSNNNWRSAPNDPLSFLRHEDQKPVRLNAYKDIKDDLSGTLSLLYLNCPALETEQRQTSGT